MIVPDVPQTAAGVALHYDELDPAYRRIWGEHVHHGYWRTGRETPVQATEALVRLVEERLALAPGQSVCDIGCGYGATAADLASRGGVAVTGLTLSAEQAKVAQARAAPGVTVLVRDWLDNGLPAAAFDRAYAIESSEHMIDKRRFFAEAFRVLRPGGRFVVCAWLAGEDLRDWHVRHLLKPICSEGRLPSMGSRADYDALAAEAGFRPLGYEDISREVRRTWSICLRRTLGKLVTDAELRRLALSSATRSRDFLLSLPRLMLALRTGAMRYGLFVWEKPQSPGGT
jgi:tocopherol O-methyltransferase